MGHEGEAEMSSAPKAWEMMRNHLVNSIPLEERDRGHSSQPWPSRLKDPFEKKVTEAVPAKRVGEKGGRTVPGVTRCLKYSLCVTLALNWHQPPRG